MPILVFDRESSRAVDRAAVARYGIPSILLMENAAIAMRDAALAMVGRGGNEGHAAGRAAVRVVILCGSGNNGGDGYALARHLHNAGCLVKILAVGSPCVGTDARINSDICHAMHLPVAAAGGNLRKDLACADLIVDALFGTGLDRPIDPVSEPWQLIEQVNSLHRPVLAADIPSGLDCDTGCRQGIAIRATRTVSFVGLKKGFFLNPDSGQYTGTVMIGDIGVPRELVEEFGAAI